MAVLELGATELLLPRSDVYKFGVCIGRNRNMAREIEVVRGRGG